MIWSCPLRMVLLLRRPFRRHPLRLTSVGQPVKGPHFFPLPVRHRCITKFFSASKFLLNQCLVDFSPGRGHEDLTNPIDERAIPPFFKGTSETHLFMMTAAALFSRLGAGNGMAAGARPTTIMFTTITTRMRGGGG